MSRVDAGGVDAGDVGLDATRGRYEAQRQALSGLMARFTADRDALIAAVRSCEERLAGMEARLEGTGDAVHAAPEPGREIDATHLRDIRHLIEQLREEQRQSVARAHVTAEHAIQRADEALRCVEDLSVGGVSGGAPTNELATLGLALDEVRAELARLGSAVIEQQQVPDDDEGLPELREAMAQVVGRIGGVEAEVVALRQQVTAVRNSTRQHARAGEPAMAAPATADLQGIVLNDLREQVAALQAAAGWSPGVNRLWTLLVASALATAFCFVAILAQ